MKQLHITILLLFIFTLCRLQAQNVNDDVFPVPHIRVKAGIQKDRIMLRWAVDQAVAWQKSNTIGFSLKRYTYMRDGKLLPESEEKDLGIFLPKPEQEWQSIVETNDNAAIVAQSLYGEDFEVEMGEQPAEGLEGLINKSQEIDQRFAFALMAADLDFEVALLAGWGYVDTDIKQDEKYVYVIELNQANNTKNLHVEQGQAVASLSDRQDLPSPMGLIGIFQDKSVILGWEYLQLRDIYTAYFIEKSEDNTNFIALGDLPVMNMNDKPDKPSQGMVYIDSLAQNGQNYSYRIRGKTIFGEYGPYSDVVTGSGKKALEASPRITFFDITADENIKIDWEFPAASEKDIQSFALLHSETDEKGSYKIVKDNIPVKDRAVTTKSLSPSNYFKIRAIGKNRDNRESFAVLIQPDDATPPAIPVELKGKIDSTGVVHLTWKPNTEKDLAGYHVFRSTIKGDEPVRLTPQALESAQYTDSVQIENLNSTVYYYVTATDLRKNQSGASQIIELEKPDVIKPEAPAFTGYKAENGEIQISWTKSYSDDASIHRLYRQAIDDRDKSWKIIYETKSISPEYEYTDKEAVSNHRYKYYLQAIDKGGLVSGRSQEITLRNTDLRPADVISEVAGIANHDKKMIELTWKVSSNDEIGEIVVYRRVGDGKATLWGTLSGAQNFLEDKNTQVGQQYTYLLKAMLKNNRPATTQTITVDY